MRREGEKGNKQDTETKSSSVAASYGESKEGSNLEYVWKPLLFGDKEDKEEIHTSEEEQVMEKKNKDGKKNHKCPTCAKSFPSRAHLKEHEISHSSTQQYRCSVCGQGFKRKNALSKHMRIFHSNGPGSVVCSCGKVFASKELMEKHKENSGQHRLLVCGECGAMYKTQANLESHLLLHQETRAGGDAWPHTCHTCQERFSSRASLRNHTRDIHSANVFPCPECSKTFRTQKQLRLHRLRRHTAGDREFLCPLCSKAFHVLKDLRRHMQTHNPAGTHECPACHSKFKTESTLRSHMKSNSKGKPYDCSICLFPCCTLEALREHLLGCHSIQDIGSDFSTTWNSKCLVCGQVFLRRSVLAQHMKTHFGPEDTQLVVLEDTEVDIAQNSLFQQDFTEPGQVGARQTRLGRVKGKASPHHEKATQAEPEVIQTRKECLPEEVDEGTRDSQTAVTPAQTDTTNETFPDTDSDRQTDSGSQEEEAESNVWGEKSVGAMETSAPGVGGAPAASSSCSVEGEETRYICEACSLVLTDMEELKVHLLTCYKEDSSDECFVVFEVDEDNKVQ